MRDTTWRKASYSNPSLNCVEVSLTATASEVVAVRVRDSKAGTGSATLALPGTAWRALLTSV